MNPRDAIAQAKAIAMLAKIGKLTYDDAKSRCQPYLKIANERGQEIAKKFNRRYSPVTFTGLVR